MGRTSGLVEASVPLGNVSRFDAVAPAGSYFTRLRAANACGSSTLTSPPNALPNASAALPITRAAIGSPLAAACTTARAPSTDCPVCR